MPHEARALTLVKIAHVSCLRSRSVGTLVLHVQRYPASVTDNSGRRNVTAEHCHTATSYLFTRLYTGDIRTSLEDAAHGSPVNVVTKPPWRR